MREHALVFYPQWLYYISRLDPTDCYEAIKTDDGRQKVIELIKDIENIEERKRKDGESYFDVSFFKKRVGD